MTSDDDVRAREIEDARAEGYARGMEQGQATARVRLGLLADELRMMPTVWVSAYGALCVSALSDGLEGRGGPDNPYTRPKVLRVRTRTSETEVRGLATRGKAPFPKGGVEVRSERLMALKSRVDRRLRTLAREIRRELADETSIPRKCTRCKKYGEESWSWCPFDGAPMESDDRR